MKIEKIISGGQTGADRAALDVALALGISCGGWCPKGRIAEDGVIHPRYPLKATTSKDHRVRTERNVKKSDGTLIIIWEAATGGTASTIEFAEKYKKPCLVVDLSVGKSLRTFKDWGQNNKIRILNVAGSRESESPGIYDRAVDFLWDALYNPKVGQRTKNESVVIEGLIKIKGGHFVRGKQQSWLDTIKMKVTVPPSDWGKLWTCGWHNMDDFTKQVWENLIGPAVSKLETRKGARGKYKHSENILRWIREYARFLYVFFSYWVKIPIEEWPDYLQRLAEMIKEDDWFDSIFRMKKGTNKPYRLTRYCIEKASKEEIERYGLRLFDDPSYFLKTYVHKNGEATKIAKFFIKGKSREEIANLAYQLPLKNFFKYLGII
jgi:hypothetical protein